MTKPTKAQKYNRTQRGLINQMYRSQKCSSKARGHVPPNYTVEALRTRLTADMQFFHLFNTWVASDYDIKLIPSLDRLDDAKPYTFRNLRLVTWEVNKHKETVVLSKPIYQYSREGLFIKQHASLCIAAKAIGKLEGSGSNISRVANGKQPTAYNFVWKWVPLAPAVLKLIGEKHVT